MKSLTAALTMMLCISLSPTLLASGKKEGKATVSFHLETEATDNPKMIFPQLANGQTRYFRRMPEITTKDMVAFSPFPSELGEDYGIVFQLKGNATNRLAAITNANAGKWLISQVNGRVVDGVKIDKQVNDGFIVIWKGVTLADIALFDDNLPRLGEEGKKKKK
ncbi:MAG: hypothetical protein WEB53_06735 [Akkermansiaceae bacterium]